MLCLNVNSVAERYSETATSVYQQCLRISFICMHCRFDKFTVSNYFNLFCVCSHSVIQMWTCQENLERHSAEQMKQLDLLSLNMKIPQKHDC
jgi:hypothetical protein